VKSTIHVHAVIGLREGRIAVKDTVCFCDACFSNGKLEPVCEGWKTHNMDAGQVQEADTAPEDTTRETFIQQEVNIDVSDNSRGQYAANTFVATIYDSQWYVGKIIEFDDEDREYQISFMVGARKSFRWAEKEDNLWITEGDIMCSVV